MGLQPSCQWESQCSSGSPVRGEPSNLSEKLFFLFLFHLAVFFSHPPSHPPCDVASGHIQYVLILGTTSTASFTSEFPSPMNVIF